MSIYETISTITPFMIFTTILFFGMLFFKERQEARKQDLDFRLKEFELRKSESKESGNKIIVENNNDSSDTRDAGGYITLKIAEERKSVFHDLLKGFEEYAALKGYKASVSVDSSGFGEISFKISIDEYGVTSSATSVKRDLDEYIHNIQSGNPVDDLPIVINKLEHAKLSMALKNRISFLQQNYEVNKNIKEFYENFISNIPAGISSHLLPTIQINSGNLDMDQRKYEANNSTNIMQGDNHSNLLEGNAVNIGSSHTERSEIIAKLDSLLSAIESDADTSIKKAARHVENIKEELEDAGSPDKSTISKWLGKAKGYLETAKKGSAVLKEAKEVYDAFGSAL